MFDSSHIKPDKGFRKTGYTVQSGYIMVWKPSHKYSWSTGYVKLHRLVMERELGRYLETNELVHHKDENKLNNDISNLQLITQAEHRAIHNILDQSGVLHFDIEEVKTLYEAGLSTREIATRLNIGKSTVGNYIKQLGISRPNISKRDSNGKFKRKK
jgi:transcriptional regulator of aromatic amino acid metabolism